MRSSHDEIRAGRVMPIELVLTGRRLPRFALLLAAMLAELTLSPFIAMLPNGLVLVHGITAILLLAALAVAGSHRLAVALFTAALLFHLTAGVFTAAPIVAAAHALRLVFLFYVVGVVFRRVLADRAVTLDTVAGAACVYMLLGIAWGSLFMLLESWRPGSFHVPVTWTQGPASDLRSSLMYFSFATLTTVGYGEIHPNDPAAGSLCAAEAVVGQLYLAIMIARLVGLHTSRAASDAGRTGAQP